MPGTGFLGRKAGTIQCFRQVMTRANSLAFRNQPCERFAILDQNKARVLVMHLIDTVSEVSGRLRYGKNLIFHKIRLSDFMDSSITSCYIVSLDRRTTTSIAALFFAIMLAGKMPRQFTPG